MNKNSKLYLVFNNDISKYFTNCKFNQDNFIVDFWDSENVLNFLNRI